ncbi:MAG: hypothetical protein JWO67_3993 [Streptosporangiaceae bacterium]|nr:hypothetical protein [Streptosporangiaceae bacterium]
MPLIAYSTSTTDSVRGWENLDNDVIHTFDTAASRTFHDVNRTLPHHRLPTSVVTGSLKVLEGLGYLKRDEDGSDDMTGRWHLTSAGRIHLDELNTRRAAA